MMNTTFRKAIKRIKVQPMPRMAGIPLRLSLSTGIILALLSCGPHMNVPGNMKTQLEEAKQSRKGTRGTGAQTRTRSGIDLLFPEPESKPEPSGFDPAFPFADRLQANVELPSETKEKFLQDGDFQDKLSGWKIKYASDRLNSIRTHRVVRDGDTKSDVIEFRRTNGRTTGSVIGMYQDVYIDLSRYDDVRLKVDVKPIYQSLTGGGWAGGVEYPVMVQIVFIDQRGEPHVWSHGFYYKDFGQYGDGTKVNENAWFTHKSPNLLGVRPDCADKKRAEDRLDWSQPVHRYVKPVAPRRITRVIIMGGGWDYTSRADNIEFILMPPSGERTIDLLFGVAAEFLSDLDNEDISEALRQKFKDHGISLSDDAAVSVKEKGMEWLITDGDKTYMIRKQGAKLNIFMNP